MMHLAHDLEWDFDSMVFSASMHFDEESEEDYD
jgi:hypothetical protein